MLERATSCLDSGARLSVRCARRASRSNRSLGSNFWSHGAGDPEISPFVAAHNSQPPLDVHGSQQQPRRSTPKPESRKTSSNAPTETPFLDFLYPPQALALLHRNGNQRAERWETRNERRLPNGFVHATRRYSSEVRRRSNLPADTEASKGLDEEPEGDALSYLEESDVGERIASKIAENTFPDDEQVATTLPTPTTETQLDPFASHSLADLAEINSAKELRSLMTATMNDAALESAETSLEPTERVWTIFENLETKDREDISLKIRLLEWLSRNRNEMAETRCLELYHSIPTDSRTLTVYKSALSVFIRSNLYGLADQGHHEALDRLENGHEVSLWLCTTAIENGMWDLASSVKTQLDAKYQGEAKTWVNTMFWRHLAEMPDLLSRAIGLSKHYRMLHQGNSVSADFEDFSLGIFNEAIVQQFKASRDENAPPVPRAVKTFRDSNIRYLVGRIQLTSRHASKFFHSVIMELVQPNSGVLYPDAHKTVSYMYQQYRSMSGIRPPTRMLRFLTNEVVQQWDDFEAKSARPSGLNPKSLIDDWVEFHGAMHLGNFGHIMVYYARRGDDERVHHYYSILCEHHPSYLDHRSTLWTLVYVHARRGEIVQAKREFEKIYESEAAVGSQPDPRVWSALLHAHSRADDLEGGAATLQRYIASGLKLDSYILHPVLELYASRGDVDSVESLLKQFQGSGGLVRRPQMYSSLMTAHVNANDVEAAHKILEDVVLKAKAGEIDGSLTECFNILLTSLALRREVDETMHVYHWMKSEDVKVNAETFSALMQALVAHRQSDTAWNMIKTVMPEQGIQPKAMHYAIVMAGFVKQHAYKTAMNIYYQMRRKNIKPTLTTNAIYTKAKALFEVYQGSLSKKHGELYPLSMIADDIAHVFRDPAAGLAAKEPQAYSPSEHHSPQALLFSQLMYVYGSRRSFEAVQELLERYKEMEGLDADGKPKPLPLRILTAVMPAYIQARQWDEVSRCWDLAKEQADAMSIKEPVPLFAPEGEVQSAPEILKLSVKKTTAPITADGSPTTVASHKAVDPSRPAPGLQHILTQPLRHQITALAFQGRFSEMISLVASVLSQGYFLDNSTWNIFIEHLLRPTPSLALLAFRLTERYLMPSFPGWMHGKAVANHSAYVQGLEYIRIRYVGRHVLLPKYKTLVKLGAALLDTRHRDALGTHTRTMRESGPNDLGKYVGTTKQIRNLAPKTLYAVQSMPTIQDKIQRKLLRRET